MTTKETESEEIYYNESLDILANKWNEVDLSQPPPSVSLSEATERAKAYTKKLEKGECEEELLFMASGIDESYEGGYVKNTADNIEEFGYKPAQSSEKVLAARKYTNFIKEKYADCFTVKENQEKFEHIFKDSKLI